MMIIFIEDASFSKTIDLQEGPLRLERLTKIIIIIYYYYYLQVKSLKNYMIRV